MRLQASKAIALLSGVATLALGSTFMLRVATPKPRPRPQLSPCAPRLLELERAVCDGEVAAASRTWREGLAELSTHAPQ
jgi:hypothetical protein